MKFGTDYRRYGGNLCTISLFEDDLLENNTRGKSAKLLAGDKSTIIDFIDEMEFDSNWLKHGVKPELFEYWKKQFNKILLEVQDKKITPSTALKSALEETSTSKVDEAKGTEDSKLNLENINEGKTKDD